MLHFNNRRVYVQTLVGSLATIASQIKKLHICGLVLLGLLTCSNVGYAQTPTPTPITKADPPTVQTPSNVGRITKWAGVSKSGIGIIGDSMITESAGNIGINITNPNDKLTIGGGLTTTGPINTTAQYNIGGNRVLSANTVNIFVGFGAGIRNTTGTANAFFGSNAGLSNTTGGSNAFFGVNSGLSNTSGGGNSLFGYQAGSSNTTGSGNAFFGGVAGNLNSTGSNNAFVGGQSGYRTTIGNGNAFFGFNVGFNNTAGGNNSFFGVNAGLSNTIELNNTFIGANSNGAATITNATALGANAVVTQSNSVVLGNSANVGIGTSAPQAKLHVLGSTAGRFDGNVTINGDLSVSGTSNLTATNAIHANNADNATSASNANTVTNGVYTTGSYANPSWITSLDGSKVTGTVANATNSVNAATADTVRVPLELIGTNNLLSLTGGGGVPTLIINNTETGGGAGIQSNIAGPGNAILANNNGSGAAITARSTGGEPTVQGHNTAVGGGAGVLGTSTDSQSGAGVIGENFYGGVAVLGRTHEGAGNALEGRSSGTGNALFAYNDGFGIAVYGASPNGLAGRFDGPVTVNGSLTVSGAANLTATSLSGQISESQVTNLITDLASKANNSGVVHLAGTETISGAKSFSAQVSATTLNLPQGTIASDASSLTLKGLTTAQGTTGGYLSLGSGNFYYPGGSVKLGAGAAGPFYGSAPGPFISLSGNDYSSGGDIMIASGHSYGGTTGGVITLNTSGASGYNYPPPGYISLQISGSESLRVASDGNVGIGTAVPQAKFHVLNAGGTAGQFDGNVTVNGNLTVTGSTSISPTVNHDSTLGGNGTTSSPLAVLSAPNGVVTTGSYANPSWITSLDGNKITLGTVVKSVNGLGDNVTLASGNNITITPSGNTLTISAAVTGSPGGPFRILDSLGSEVGVWFGPENGQLVALRYLPTDDVWLHLRVSPSGVNDDDLNAKPNTYWETTDCTGTEYTFQGTPGQFYERASVSQGIVYYPDHQMPPTSKTLQSKKHFGPCESITPVQWDVVPWASFPVSNFGTPPFKLTR